MPRSPLTEKFLRIVALRDEVKTWPQDEQDFFLDMLAPEPEQKKPAAKKASRKSSKSSSSKSPRATGIEQQLSKRREQGQVGTTTDDNYDGGGQCSDCGMAADMPIHSPEGGYITYHPFRSGAPTVPSRSPANGGAESITANSVDGTDDVGTVAHGAGGGD